MLETTILRETTCADCEGVMPERESIRCHRCGELLCVVCHAGPDHEQCGDPLADTVIVQPVRHTDVQRQFDTAQAALNTLKALSRDCIVTVMTPYGRVTISGESQVRVERGMWAIRSQA